MRSTAFQPSHLFSIQNSANQIGAISLFPRNPGVVRASVSVFVYADRFDLDSASCCYCYGSVCFALYTVSILYIHKLSCWDDTRLAEDLENERMREYKWARPAADSEIIPVLWEVFGEISAVEGVLVCDLRDWVHMREWSVWGWDESKLRTCTDLFGPLLPVLFHSPSLSLGTLPRWNIGCFYSSSVTVTHNFSLLRVSLIILNIEMQGIFPP